MSKLFLFPLTLAIVATSLLATAALGADASPEAARLELYAQADGTRLFALSLKPTVQVAPAASHDVVVLVDTSASQTGEYRDEAMAALDALLAGLDKNDQVKIFGVDLNAIAMNKSFAAPGSDEVKAAVKKLAARAPLGSTDMATALHAAVDSFSGQTKPRAVVYIGDGMSPAHLLATKEFEALTKALVDARVPVSSYGVGPRLDLQLLGALAGRTGGVMLAGGGDVSGAAAGKAMAQAADGVVYWPTATTLPKDRLTEVFPQQMPPLRTDRDSVLIGTLKGDGPIDIKVTANTAAGTKELAWSVTPGKSSDANKYLVALVDRARVDGGASLPLIDSASLQFARNANDMGTVNFVQLAHEALASGSLDSAARLAEEALRRSPGDHDASAILAEVKRRRGQEDSSADLNLVGKTPAEKPAPAAGAFAQAFERDRELISGQVTADVQVAIDRARKEMDVSPDVAIQNLKIELENVERVAELNPDIRNQLVDKLRSALRLASQRQELQEYRRQREAEKRASAEERMLVTQSLARDQERLKQLMDRFDSLMRESRYQSTNYAKAQEEVAVEAQAIVAENKMAEAEPTVAAAETWAGLKRINYENDQVRLLRRRSTLAAMLSVDKALIPFDDNEPILYPDPEVWKEMSERRKEKYSAMDLAVRGEAERRINSALKDPTTLNFVEAPLSDVIDYLKDVHNIEIQIDQRALDDMGIGSDTPVTRNLKGVSLHSALRLMLRDLDLTYLIENEVLLITTPEQAEERLSTRVYPVADLVLPIQNIPMGGMGGMMGGGMGGGMGGMGGGMGGMGGGMGGMGGMGGGMGGGMFNVPGEVVPPQIFNQLPAKAREVLPKKALPGGFQVFSVNDDLATKPAATSTPSDARPATSQPDKTPQAASIQVPDGADRDAAWDKYFAENKPAEAAVRETIRRLMREKKVDDVIALISVALRHRQAQPWMYEAMSLAMQIDGRGPEEVERAVMSAVDWATEPTDLMYVAAYLADIGLDARALKIFEQVSRVWPDRPEPYLNGLRIAQKLNDVEGIKWATLGILGRAWPKEQEDVWLKGMRAARATLERLKKENRVEEAQQYEAALDEALVRDVVARVSWTGDADVDLVVEEPSGTVCSHRNPRTAGGGIMMGDGFSSQRKANPEGSSEMYVCPRGFNGNYKIGIRRVWGEVTAGKVTVDVCINWNSKKAQRISKRVSLGEDGTLVTFDLDTGRRKESVEEQQVANAVAGQLAIRQQVLAQQLAAAVDPTSMMSLALSRQNSTSSDNANVLFPLRQGAVGYQPVIITLPEGTNVSVTAVISADRRYVRVTPSPLFSGITEVNTFNYVTGDSGTSNGGTGGTGFGGLGGSSGSSGLSSGF